MLTLSRKSLLALEAVVDVALHARPDPVQAREITRRQGVPGARQYPARGARTQRRLPAGA